MKKRRKNKVTAILVVAVLIVVAFAGCGKKKTEEPQESVGSCTLLVECSVILDNMENLDPALEGHIPADGIILKKDTVNIGEKDSVYDILKRTLEKEGILMEASFTGNMAYIEGIDNIYEFSCGQQSGWMYCVNGEYSNKSCSDYQVKDKDVIEWHYTCNLGEDLK